MSRISPYLQKILNERWARNVRQAIHDAISQCYNDVNAPALQTEAMEAAVQAKIDAGEMAALTIADGTLTGAKLVDGTIPTAKIADGAITAGKIASGVIPTTDTTLTQPGVPADAKAVGDALANAFTGETLTVGELMKYVLSSKYDDFKLVDGYGYFDAVKLLSSVTDLTKPSYVTNRVFRISPSNTSSKNVLIDFTEPTEIFSPDFPMYKEVEWPGSYDTLGSMPEGYWYSKDPSRSDLYYTIPMESYGSATSFGDFAFNLLDGSIGIKMDSTKIREYDPSEVISAITSGGSISTVTTENTTFYKGFLTYTWTDLFDFERTNIVLYRMYNNLGFCEEYTGYAKECVWLEGTTRIWYRVKADAVSAKTIDAIKDYLVNTRHLKFYYVAEEVTA